MADLNLNDTQEFKLESNVSFDASGLSDVGLVREKNDDQFLIVELAKRTNVLSSSFKIDPESTILDRSKGLVLIVADGVGGAPAGERASQLATEEILRHLKANMPWFLRLHHEHEDELISALKDAVRRCELAVEYEAELIPAERGMGTTLTMAYILWPRLNVVHVGDSRCYICRNSKMLQVTRDHTFAQALVEAGQLEQHQAKTSGFSHVLVNSIGRGTSELHAEVYTSDLMEGDQILLCTDGLTDMLEDDEISTILQGSESPGVACKKLVDAAKLAGGRDNITVAIGRTEIEKHLS